MKIQVELIHFESSIHSHPSVSKREGSKKGKPTCFHCYWYKENFFSIFSNSRFPDRLVDIAKPSFAKSYMS